MKTIVHRLFLHSAALLAASMVGIALSGCSAEPEETGPGYRAMPQAKSVEKTYRLAIHPLHNPQKLYERYAPLAEYLSQHIPGLQLEVEASNSYAHYETKIRDRAPEFLLPNPYQTLMALDMGYRVVAEAGDSEDFHGIFIVRKDSPLNSPGKLEGKVVAYPAATALAAAMLPQKWLVDQGVKVMQAVDNRYVGSQESAILNVLHRKADAAATWPPPWRAFQRDYPEDAAQLRVIWETPSLINNSLMARKDVPADLVNQLRECLMHMHEDPEGARILMGMETQRINPADDARYQAVVGGFLKKYQAQVGPLP